MDKTEVPAIPYSVPMDLLLAADCGDLELVKMLVEEGANVNQKFRNDKFNFG